MVWALVIVGCSDPTPSPEPTTTTTLVSTTTSQPPTDGCGPPGSFNDGGNVANFPGTGSDARAIGLISWETRPDCERFTIAFQSNEGAPATTPPAVRVGFIDGLPILRIAVSSTASVITDQSVETAMVDRLYVVRSLDGTMFVDLHLGVSALARVTVHESPAEVVIELRPGILDPVARPSISERLVVTSPVEGARVALLVRVGGYARSFGDGVLIIATAGANILHEQSAETPDNTTGWVEYRATLSLPRGPVLIFVGEDEPGPAGLAGIVIPVTVE